MHFSSYIHHLCRIYTVHMPSYLCFICHDTSLTLAVLPARDSHSLSLPLCNHLSLVLSRSNSFSKCLFCYPLFVLRPAPGTSPQDINPSGHRTQRDSFPAGSYWQTEGCVLLTGLQWQTIMLGCRILLEVKRGKCRAAVQGGGGVRSPEGRARGKAMSIQMNCTEPNQHANRERESHWHPSS